MAVPLILIVGAGPTGMTAAIELKRAGLDMRIVDKSGHMALHSQAFGVQARTLEQFQRYGIAGEAVDQGRKLIKAVFCSEGKQIVSVALDQISSRYPFLLMLPQTQTEAILNQRMEALGAKTERGVGLTSLTQQDGRVVARLRHSDGKEEELVSRWVIGCDGAHSSVREMLGIPFLGGGVGLSFFLGDLEIDGPDAPGDELSVHFHDGDVVFLARISSSLTRMIVAVHARQRETLDRELTVADFQEALDNASVHVTVRSAEWMTPFHVNDRQARDYRAGSVFLAGDASHIHSPVGGQGMNTGIQDVANLVWKLAAVSRGAGEGLLNSYQEERAEVGKALLQFTERGLKMATAVNPLMETLRDALLPVLTSLKPVQKAMLGFISETAIEYRWSSIVADHGGDGHLKAGDRMPDLALMTRMGETTLLADWTEAKHLAIVLGGTDAEMGEIRTGLSRARVLGIRAADLDMQGRQLLGKDKKLLILRPDGYVGFRGSLAKSADWAAYGRQDGLMERE
jgi:2-polyprenyl-6-methoxyphenol hydroxylase-like FAD-dependent oxidoreductase